MVRIERDPAFWANVASHLQVAPHIGVGPEVVGEFALRPGVTPLAAEHGGFLFSTLDGMGMVRELHTLFTPEGWGREVARAAHEAFALIFAAGAQVIVTHERADWWRSAPPKSHGWAVAGEWAGTAIGEVRMWVLTLDAWRASPAVRRRACH
ncbi:MAG TPA: hypothetical protein VII63_08555 [Caulobacteraceae bacterium]